MTSMPPIMSMPNQYRNQLQGVGFENDLHNRPAFTCYSGIHYHSIFKARVKPAGYLLLRRPRTRMSADGMSGKLTTVVVTAGSRISADNSPKRSSSMIHYLSPSEIVLWACAAAGQAILSFLLFKSASGQRYPAFSHYVYYVTAKSIVLFYIACSYKYAIYFWAYYPASFLACLLMVPVIMEDSSLVRYGAHWRRNLPDRSQCDLYSPHHGYRGTNANFRHTGISTGTSGLFDQTGPELAIKDCRSCHRFRSVSEL